MHRHRPAPSGKHPSNFCGSTPSRGRAGRRAVAGASLIEILVSLLLMSFGMLAMGAMQNHALATSRNSGHRAVAATLASEAADVLRTNAEGFSSGGYDLKGYLGDAAPVTHADAAALQCAYPSCTPATLARYDLATLKARVRSELPQGGLQVVRPGAGVPSTTEADLWIVWNEPRTLAHKDATGGAGNAVEKEFDNCPDEAKVLKQVPRCFYMRVVL